MLAQLLPFLGVSAVVICAPGPDTALTVRNALTGGRRGGVLTAAGVAMGQFVWTVAASVGIARLFLASEVAFSVVKFAGALYLVFLGVQALLSAYRGVGHGHEEGLDERPRVLSPVRALRQGVLSDLSNPKMAAFFLSLLPQFVPIGSGSFSTFLIFGSIFCLMTFGWLAAYGLLVHRARHLLLRGPIRRAVDAVSGTALVAFGVALAFEQRP